LPQLPKLWDSIKQELDNKIYLALVIAATISMITGFISEDGFLGWMQGFSIYVGLFLLVAFAAGNDYLKDKQFVHL
jgi:hypothetical protein